ncbi:hypothetical protein HWV62_32712 [Athelia sp. TMB]|nr:hypothetical protein HWV62_32712 [Athelia sp. TMB]
MTVSSVAVTDLIPLLFGLGAGLGGPLGGWINDTLGWRAAFLLQTPIMVFSFILVAVKVNIKLPAEIEDQPIFERLKRIDFFGSLTLVGTVGCLLLGFSLKSTEEMAWSHPVIWGLFIASACSGCLFILVEARWAPYPVMPLHLITQRTPLAVSLGNLFCSISAFSTIAISTGSVFAGWMMRRTGKLYTLTLMSSLMTIMAGILLVFWRDNSSPIHLWLDIVPQGFGMASFITTTLIAMIAGVAREDMAVATGVTYLFRTTGQVLGVSLSGTILQAVLQKKLQERITGAGAAEIIDMIRHSTEVVRTLEPHLKQAAVDSYADALRVVFICQTACNVLGFLASLPIQENPLPGSPVEQQKLITEQESSDNDTDV